MAFLLHHGAGPDAVQQNGPFPQEEAVPTLTAVLHDTGFDGVRLAPLGGPPLLRQAIVARAVRA